MGMRTVNDPYGNPAVLVDQMLGTSYDVVKKVATNIDFVKKVSTLFNENGTVVANIHKRYVAIQGQIAFTLPIPVLDVNAITVFVNNIWKSPVTSFIIDNDVLIFNEPLKQGVYVDVMILSEKSLDILEDILENTQENLNQAEIARDKAQDWAEAPEDTEVAENSYSAFHHSKKAEAFSEDAAQFSVDAEIAKNAAIVAKSQAENARNQAAMSSANAQASSRTVATWTVLSSLTGSSEGEGAEVIDSDTGEHTDPVVGGTVSNAGRYSWSMSSSGWKRIGETGLSGKASTNQVDAIEKNVEINNSVQNLNAHPRVFPLGENNLNIVEGVVTSKNRLLRGMRESGTVFEAHMVREVLGNNNHDLISGLSDKHNRLFHGVKRNGGFVGAGLVHDPLHENNLDLIGLVVVDADNRVISGMTSNGVPIGYATTAEVFRRKEMFLLVGQSLAEGGANAAITTTPPYISGEAMRFVNGPVGKQSEVIGPGLEHLAEEVNETISTGMARRILADHPEMSLLMAGQAWGGKTIAEISLGAADGIYEKIQVQMDLAAALTSGAVIRAFGMIQGEADGLINNTNYHHDLETYRRQFALDAIERLGQTEIPLMLTCQTSSVSGYRGDWAAARDSFPTPLLQLKAALSNPYIVLVGPKYQYTYVDHSHINALSTRLHGEKYGQVWRHVILNRKTWLPVHASTVTRDNDAIVLDLHSPVGMPIEVDTVSVLDPGNLGFNLLDAGVVTIGSVTQTGDYQITIECSGNVPDSSRLSYAFHNGNNPTSGWQTGARGCIRDSDPTRSIYTNAAMPNWLCAFQHNF